jgi:hypothetical protein
MNRRAVVLVALIAALVGATVVALVIHSPTSRPLAPSTLIGGDSKSECAELPFQDTGLSAIKSAVSNWDSLTHSTATCLLAYNNGVPNWREWDVPWITDPRYGYTQWVAHSPTTRQVVLQVDLIPTSLQNKNDPLPWERSCANGRFNSYATTLGDNLVAAGLEHTVIRLGAEANGAWETDFVGSTAQEQHLWAKCFDNEVMGLRASGGKFLIDWNPNACLQDIPFANYYPGNAYVNILGLDIYDESCTHYGAAISFANLSNEPVSLTQFVAFANSKGKAMSFPEWGMESSHSKDDPNFVSGIGSTVCHNDFAFEAYFDAGARGTVELNSGAPESLAAFQEWFGSTKFPFRNYPSWLNAFAPLRCS